MARRMSRTSLRSCATNRHDHKTMTITSDLEMNFRSHCAPSFSAVYCYRATLPPVSRKGKNEMLCNDVVQTKSETRHNNEHSKAATNTNLLPPFVQKAPYTVSNAHLQKEVSVFQGKVQIETKLLRMWDRLWCANLDMIAARRHTLQHSDMA